jgi:glycosyltransferase involved in cell wall biosynthesis
MRNRPRVRAERRDLGAALKDAALVVAESVGVAQVVVRATDKAGQTWVLALPSERLYTGAPSQYAEGLRAVAPEVAGFLADSELARESVERATSTWRTRVEVFPPLAVNRPCPECGGQRADGPGEVAQLASWWALIGGAEASYSHPAVRLRGLAAAWPPAERLDWAQRLSESPWTVPDVESPDDWSTDSQIRAVRSIMDTERSPVRAPSARHVVVSGYDLKFIRELAGWLDRRDDLRITLDEWRSLGQPSASTDSLIADADTILAEWARPSAVWLSQRKRPGQLLVVRLHRYELDCPYPRDIDIDRVDAVVHVSTPVGRRIRDELGWPTEKLVYIPNFVDLRWLDRPKLPGARFGLGFVGMEWANKRFDLALDLLAAVREEDPRFTLFVRSVLPWDNTYAWPRPEEREFVGWCMERIDQDSRLRGAVVFEPPGRDMARWYRRVGHVLSMSDIESFHLAAAEGMASGAIPVIRPWPGAAEIYGEEWVHPSVDEAVAAVLANADLDTWTARAKQAQADILRLADPRAVVDAWAELLHGDVASARQHFARA